MHVPAPSPLAATCQYVLSNLGTQTIADSDKQRVFANTLNAQQGRAMPTPRNLQL